jgi:hypothetical protein
MSGIGLKCNLVLSQAEFQEIYTEGNFTNDYSIAVRKFISQKLNFIVKAHKKKNLKKTIKVDLKCVECKSHATLSLDSDYVLLDPVNMIFHSTCLHVTTGNVKNKFGKFEVNLFLFKPRLLSPNNQET